MKKQMGTTYLKRSAKCLHPRVGEEYQAQLPDLPSPSDPYGTSCGDTVVLESPPAKWNVLEVVSFLMALYIFGKDFFLVRKFLSGKTVKDIQLLYYGRFYNSNKYRRWAKCRKSVRGGKPLTESGIKWIFSRLHPQVPQEFRGAADKAQEGFTNKTVSLVDYALLLKNLVGPKALLEGIQRYFSYLDVDEGQTGHNISKNKRKTCKDAIHEADPPTVPVKRKLTKLESKSIKDENVDQEIKNVSNDEVSESSNGRRRSRRSRVMSIEAMEAFETCSI